MTDLLLIRITCPSRRVADHIADAAVEQRLAACANTDGPVTSTYRWKGVVEHAFEFLVWLKAPAANFDKIEALVKDKHPYELPGITASALTHVNADYAAWIIESTDT